MEADKIAYQRAKANQMRINKILSEKYSKILNESEISDLNKYIFNMYISKSTEFSSLHYVIYYPGTDNFATVPFKRNIEIAKYLQENPTQPENPIEPRYRQAMYFKFKYNKDKHQELKEDYDNLLKFGITSHYRIKFKCTNDKVSLKIVMLFNQNLYDIIDNYNTDLLGIC